MTQFASLRNNAFGRYVDDPKAFSADIDLLTDIPFTQKSDDDIILTDQIETPINFGAVTNGKIAVIQTDTPILVRVNGGNQVICDPLIIITNKTPTLASITALTIQRISATVTANVKVRVRG